MTYEDLQKAAQVFNRINSVRSYVTKERFVKMANFAFGITDERKLDVMYGMLNVTPKMVYYIANDNEDARKMTRFPEWMHLYPKVIEIAEAAYALHSDWERNSVPTIKNDEEYRQSDKRRYFYTEGGEHLTLDVSMGQRDDILLLSQLLQRDGVKMFGAARHLGYLDGEMKGNSREHLDYYEGDIYFLYGDVGDRIFYDWYSHGDDAGVYIATDKGWRKLLYTPSRGYIDNKGCIQFMDEDHFYSNYMLEASGKKFLYVGNIHCDGSVLVEVKKKKKKG